MTVRVSGLPLEVTTSGDLTHGGTPARVSTQSLEVQSKQASPVRVSTQSLDVLNTLNPPARVSTAVVEVLSSSIDSLFDRSFGFWALPPNGEIIERYEWATDIQTARSGEQVRASLRSYPRVQIEFDVMTSDDAEMALIDALITGWQGRSFYLPVWQDRRRLDVTLSGTETSIPVDLAAFQYQDGGFVGIWSSATDFQILQILEVDEEAGELIFAAPIDRGWLPSAWIAPIRRTWLLPETSATRFTGAAMQARLVFNAQDPVKFVPLEWDSLDGGAQSIEDMVLFSHRPNWTQGPRITYRRRFETMGDETVRPWRQDPSGRGWITRQELHTLTNRVEINRMLQWAAFIRGRAIQYLAPVRDAAITITRANGEDDSEIYIEGRDYSALLAEITPRTYLALRDSAGWIVRRITTVESEGSEDKLNLNASIGREGSPSSWQEAYLCEPAHLSSDVIEIQWWDRETADIVISHEQVTA